MAEKPRGMKLKFVLSQLRTCTHESKNMFVFFESLRFYGEQESVLCIPENSVESVLIFYRDPTLAVEDLSTR